MKSVDDVIDKIDPKYFDQLKKRIESPGYFQTFRLKDLLPSLLAEVPELPTFEDHKDWHHITGDGYGFRNLVGKQAEKLGKTLAKRLGTKMLAAHYTYCTKGYKLREHCDSNGTNSFVVLMYLFTGPNDPLIFVTDKGKEKIPAAAGMVTGMEAFITHYVDTMEEDRLLIKFDME